MRVALFSLYLPSFLFPQFFVTYRERETTAPSPSNLSVTRPTHYTPWADDHVKVVSCHHSLSPCFHSESEREISSFWPTIELLMANIHWLITYGRLNVVLLCRKNPTTQQAFSPKVQGTSAVSQYFINPHSFIITVALSFAFSRKSTVSVRPSSQRLWLKLLS